jgi:hypothetical protein
MDKLEDSPAIVRTIYWQGTQNPEEAIQERRGRGHESERKDNQVGIGLDELERTEEGLRAQRSNTSTPANIVVGCDLLGKM